jgi:hypothetical protein
VRGPAHPLSALAAAVQSAMDSELARQDGLLPDLPPLGPRTRGASSVVRTRPRRGEEEDVDDDEEASDAP